MIRVLIVDDHGLVRTGIKRILDETRGIEVVGEAETGEYALAVTREQRPDVVLMDVNMPGMGGLEATRRLRRRCRDVKIIALTVHADAPFPARLLEAGASGYLTKGCDAVELVGAIRAVCNGNRYIGNDIAQELALALLPGADRSPFDELSCREIEVMMMLVQGHDTRYMSQLLSLSPKTVSTYKYRLYEKLAVRNDVQLTRLAIRHGIVEAAAAD